MHRAFTIVSILMVAAIFVGCAEETETTAPAAEPSESGEQLAEAPSDTRTDALPLLAAVPSDTPYVWLTAEPLPFDELPFQVEQLVPLLDKVLSHLEPSSDAEVPTFGRDRVRRLTWATLTELDGNLSKDGLQSLGMHLQPAVVIYGLGLFPAARIELADADVAGATLTRVLERSALEITPHTLSSGSTLHSLQLGERFTLVVGIDGQTLVAAVTPNAMLQTTLDHFANGPAESLADSGALDDLAREYGNDNAATRGLGYVDTVRVVDGLRGEGAPLIAASLSALGVQGLEGVCGDEWRGIASKFPRIVVTGEPVSMFDLRSATVTVETDAALRTGLASVRGDIGVLEMPASADAPVFVLSPNLDVDALLAFAAGQGGAIAQDPFQCDGLARMNTAATRIALAPLLAPDGLTNLRGGHLVVEAFTDSPAGGRGIPRGWAAVDSTDVDSFWEWVAPKLVALDGDNTASAVLPTRSATAVDLALRPRVASKVQSMALSRTDRGLHARFGAADKTHEPDWSIDHSRQAPLLRFGWNSGKLWQSRIASRDDEIDDQLAGIMGVWAGVVGQYGLRTMSIDVDDRGIVLRYDRNALP